MSRKNILTSLTTPKLTAVNSEDQNLNRRRTPALSFTGRGPLGSVTRSIDDLASRANTAKVLEDQLTSGQTIVELDTSLIDPSFVADRLSKDDKDYRALRDSISANGQASPILVRPHPTDSSRYQVAFGHRRLRAAQEVGRSVRAVIRNLSDRDLILAQGQENSARANLSFIEKAQFARKLEDAGYDRETIMSALTADKTTISRFIAVATKVPFPLISGIGAAPGIGRDRWIALAELFETSPSGVDTTDLLNEHSFQTSDSDERFSKVYMFVEASIKRHKQRKTNKRRDNQRRIWLTNDGLAIARISVNDKSFTVSLNKNLTGNFGDYLLEHMDRLYADYTQMRMKSAE